MHLLIQLKNWIVIDTSVEGRSRKNEVGSRKNEVGRMKDEVFSLKISQN